MQATVQSKENILAIIEENKAKLEALGVKRLELFGSFLRGEQNESSDIDFLVEFEPIEKSYKNLEPVKDFLEESTGRNVELIPAHALAQDKYIGPYILGEIASQGKLKMNKSPLPFLKHILDEAILLEHETINMSQDEFERSELIKRAFARSLEIMGEAAKRLPDEFRKKYRSVDWKGMAGMRDRLIHGYDLVDYQTIWEIVKNDIPSIRKQIEQIIAEETKSNQ